MSKNQTIVDSTAWEQLTINGNVYISWIFRGCYWMQVFNPDMWGQERNRRLTAGSRLYNMEEHMSCCVNTSHTVHLLIENTLNTEESVVLSYIAYIRSLLLLFIIPIKGIGFISKMESYFHHLYTLIMSIDLMLWNARMTPSLNKTAGLIDVWAGWDALLQFTLPESAPALDYKDYGVWVCTNTILNKSFCTSFSTAEVSPSLGTVLSICNLYIL